MIAALDPPTAGMVTVSNENLNAMRPGRRARRRGRLLTHVYQRPSDNLLAHLTARQQLLRIARPRAGREDVVAEALDELGLEDRADHVPREMSGGEQQRLAFARAVVAGHDLVIADEPTAELDTASADAVLDAVDLLARRGVTVLVATHDPRVLARTSQIVTLRDGAVASVTASGTEFAVIDRSGRLQLPPEVRGRFPERRAVLAWDDASERLTVDPP
jgi:putative ABC transport system ATP-binding protein